MDDVSSKCRLIDYPQQAYLRFKRSDEQQSKEINDGYPCNRFVRACSSSRFHPQRAGRHPHLQSDGPGHGGFLLAVGSCVSAGRRRTATHSSLTVEFDGEAAPPRLIAGGFFFGARGQRHSVRNVSDEPARVLVLGLPSSSLDQMFTELDATTVGSGVPEIRTVAAIAARHGVTIELPTT
jgi:hypothetical protein